MEKKHYTFTQKGQVILLHLFCMIMVIGKSQVVNYVSNGGFEEVITNSTTPLFYSAKYWGGTDSTKYYGEVLSGVVSPIKVPLSSYTYQWPRHGNNHLTSGIFSSFTYNNRGYPRNRLKQTLEAGKSYCFSMYVNLSNQSTYAIDAIGGYFGDGSLDTIIQCNFPITYYTPQVENPVSNIVSDTLNWVLVRGQFTALGTEKYLMLGNFRGDVFTNSVLTNPTNSPAIFSEYLFDDVSCIELNLPAFAGRDTSVVPGSPVFLGRQPDVGIDEACVWYKLPGTVPIDTIAGFWVNPSTTSTYVVVQSICGLVKSDTVVLHMNLTAIQDLNAESRMLKVYPNPANDLLSIETEFDTADNWNAVIQNNLGQIVHEQSITFKNQKADIDTKAFENGVYFMLVSYKDTFFKCQRFVVAR